jgi:hypothetical protein
MTENKRRVSAPDTRCYLEVFFEKLEEGKEEIYGIQRTD